MGDDDWAHSNLNHQAGKGRHFDGALAQQGSAIYVAPM